MSEETTFEQALKNLEEAVTQLEQGKMPLDEALDCFEAGVRSANLCRKKLQDVEARIDSLSKDAAGEFVVKPFDDGDDRG